jgi:hypothetical protein
MFYSSRVRWQVTTTVQRWGTCHMRREERNNPPFPIFPPALVTAAIGGQGMRGKEAKEFIYATYAGPC